MRIISYNICDGGKERINRIISLLESLKPDFLALQEANGFDEKMLKQFSHRLHLPYSKLSKGGYLGEHGSYDTASLSVYPITSSYDYDKKLDNSALKTLIESDIGKIEIINTHLTPATEKGRMDELKMIFESVSEDYAIILGDLNSLSPKDGYDKSMIHSFNDVLLKKFTTEGNLSFDVIRRLSDSFNDSAIESGNAEPTVPTRINLDIAHSRAFRLDYIFISNKLLPYLRSYKVIKTEQSEESSDHYPVMLELDF